MPPSSIPVDRGGFLTLFEELKDPMYRFLYRLSRDAHDAEDLLQETFATLWRKRDQFRGEGSLAGYVRKIGYRTYLNARPKLLRRKAERTIDAEPSGRDAAPDEWVARADEREQRLKSVRGAVEALPESWREPFVLFRYEGLTCSEIAECLGVTPKAVELRLARALKAVSARVLGMKAAPGGSGSAA
jgi:RNA polymerase sigma factor (sigma-70 family)